jgi:hypothetical protein
MPTYKAATFGESSLLKVSKKGFSNKKHLSDMKTCSKKNHSHGSSANKRTLKTEQKQ